MAEKPEQLKVDGIPINRIKTGMAITQVHRRLTRRAQIQENIAFFAVVAGTATSPTVGLPIAAGTVRTAGSASAFVWFFRRTDVSPYPLIPP